MIKKFLCGCLTIVLLSSCATAKDMTSEHYLPEWENQLFRFPAPSESSGGYWAAKAAYKVSHGIGRVLLVPVAFLSNIVVNAYYVPTWPIRRIFRGDRRLIVWNPVFGIGDDVGSDYFGGEWNKGLS